MRTRTRAAKEAPDKPDRAARTRERLLSAATELLCREGASALSVTGITRRVGVHHSLFYRHFKDLQACLAAAADRALRELGPVHRELRRAQLQRAVSDKRGLVGHFEDALDHWLQQRPFVELLLTHRLEASPMGEVFANSLTEIRSEMTAEVWEVAHLLGVAHVPVGEAQALADLHLTHWLWALESLVTGRANDRRALATTLAELYTATNNMFFERVTRRSHEQLVEMHFPEPRRTELTTRRQALRAYLLTHDADDFIAHFGEGDLGKAVAFCMAQLSQHFLPGRPRHPARNVYRVFHGGACVERALSITPGACRLEQQPPEHPAATIVTVFLAQPSGMATLLDVMAGVRHLDACVRAGTVAVEGDVLLAADAVGWFYAP